MIRNQKIKGTFICGPLFFKWMGIFQSWLDCSSIGVWVFIHYSKYKLFHLQKSLYAGVHLLQFLNALSCSPITFFLKCIKLHQMLPLFFTVNLAYVLEINNLPKILVSSTYTRFIVESRDKIWCNKKGLFWHYIL